MKRKICNFANASAETTRKGAIYQRGQYYVEMKTDRARDPFKYAIFINDSLLGFTGQLENAKRFCQSVYLALPFETDVNESMKDILERLRKKYKIRLRPSLKPNKQKKVKAAATQKPKAKPKAEAKPKAKPKAEGKDPIVEVIQQEDGRQLIQVVRKGKMTAKQRNSFIKQFKGTSKKKPTAEGFASGYTIIRDRYELDDNSNRVIEVIRDEAQKRLNNGDIKLLKALRKLRIVDELLNPSDGIQGRLF